MDPATWNQAPAGSGRLATTEPSWSSLSSSSSWSSLSSSSSSSSSLSSRPQNVSSLFGPTSAGDAKQDYSALFSCVARLLTDQSTGDVIRDLIDGSRLTDEPQVAGSLARATATATASTATTTTTTMSTTNSWPPASTMEAQNTQLINSTLDTQYSAPISLEGQQTQQVDKLLQLVNWTALSKKLPAYPAEYQLEALNENWQLYLTIIYTLTAVTSFILNAITVIVLTRSRRSELRKYLINLSVSDLLMSLFSIPFTYTEYMLGRWIFAFFLCPVVRFVVTLSVFVSVATMTVIGINRHLAIMYPLKRKKYSKFRRWTVRRSHVIILIWLLGIAISMPEYLMFSAEPFCYNHQLVYDCRQTYGDSISDSYTVFIYLCTFVIPLALLSYLYTSIGLKLWRQKTPGNVDVNRDLTMHCKRVKVVKMLLVVVVLFAVMWLPLQTFSMIMFLYPDIRAGFMYQSIEYNIFIATYFSCHWLSMAHSCLNPLVYCFMNDKFRSELHALICHNKLKRQQQQLTETYSTTIRSHLNNNNINNNTNSFVQVHSFCGRPPAAQPASQRTLTTTLSSSSNMAINNRLETSGRPPNGNHANDDDDDEQASPSIAFDVSEEPEVGGAIHEAEAKQKSPEKMLKLVNKLANCNHHKQQVFVELTTMRENERAPSQQEPEENKQTLIRARVTETLTEEEEVEEFDKDEEEEDEGEGEHDEDDGRQGHDQEGGQRTVDLVVVVGQQELANCPNAANV